jgi:hypothetical protein
MVTGIRVAAPYRDTPEGDLTMKFIASAAGAVLLACAFAAPANATPVAPASTIISTDAAAPEVVQVRWRSHRGHHGYRGRHSNRGHHYGWTRGRSHHGRH